MGKNLNLNFQSPPKYLTPADPDAFKDMQLKDSPNDRGYKMMDNPVFCPVCNGYGGWHLKIDAYGVGKHFNAHCSQCNGWGYVPANSKSATCIHDFTERTIGNCLHKWTCTKCGEERIVDSSG